MIGSKDSIYWDSCIFLTYIKTENREDPNDLSGTEELFTFFDMGQIDIVTSSITFTEVLEGNITPEVYNKFLSIFDHTNCQIVDVTRRIAELASELRNYCRQTGCPTISVPDCIHLATAILWPCDILYTFDGTGQRPGLLSLPIPVAGKYKIQIQKPIPTRPPQLTFNI